MLYVTIPDFAAGVLALAVFEMLTVIVVWIALRVRDHREEMRGEAARAANEFR